MSTLAHEAARIERSTSLYNHMCATILHYYVKGAVKDGLENAGFPVSGDMLRHVRKASKEALTGRRRSAASLLSEHEARSWHEEHQ